MPALASDALRNLELLTERARTYTQNEAASGVESSNQPGSAEEGSCPATARPHGEPNRDERGRLARGTKTRRPPSPVSGPRLLSRPTTRIKVPDKEPQDCPGGDRKGGGNDAPEPRYPEITPNTYGPEAAALVAVTGNSAPIKEAPRLGRGAVNVWTANGTWVTQACAVSSTTQLLAKAYGHALSNQVVADLARNIRSWAGISAEAHIEIADAWWVTLKHFLPIGPWPRLLVLTALGHLISFDRTMVLQVPGPSDGRTLVVLGDGTHFDPVWWPSPNGLQAFPPSHCQRSTTSNRRSLPTLAQQSELS